MSQTTSFGTPSIGREVELGRLLGVLERACGGEAGALWSPGTRGRGRRRWPRSTTATRTGVRGAGCATPRPCWRRTTGTPRPPSRAAARETAARLGATPLLGQLDALIRRGRLKGTTAGRTATGAGRTTPLTGRERDVLGLPAVGRSSRQIGEELYVTGKTASVHVCNILAKPGAASRTEAVAIAYQEGLITREETVG